jgi:hypothetical protein
VPDRPARTNARAAALLIPVTDYRYAANALISNALVVAKKKFKPMRHAKLISVLPHWHD